VGGEPGNKAIVSHICEKG